MTLPRTTAWGLSRLARSLTIGDRRSGDRQPWHPHPEQEELWELLERHRRLLIAKPRKIGISTGVELDDLVWTHAADRAGNRVRTVVAIDTDDKAMEHAEQFEDWIEQWKIAGAKAHGHGITLRNGSAIDCITAGGRQPGRGGTIHRLHVTELPYWSKPRRNYQALRSSCVDSAIVCIETTMTTTDEDGFCEELWALARAGRNEFHAHFWKVQDHESYKADPALLTPEQWETARAHGFSDKRAAAWWFYEALPNRCAGDFLQLLHDFPQCEEDLFAAGEGRVILVTPPMAHVHSHLTIPGVRGDTWSIEVYGEGFIDELTGRWMAGPIRHSGQCVVSVDTAGGKGRTDSIVIVQDKRDGRPLACFASNLVLYDDLARVAQVARDAFSTVVAAADLAVEDNGIGDATCQELDKLGVPHWRFHQDADMQEQCIAATKTRIEAGMRGAPRVLRDEVKRFVKEEGNYRGKKDAIMAYGIGQVHARTRPFVPVYNPEERANRVHLEDRLREDMARGENVKRPKWG